MRSAFAFVFFYLLAGMSFHSSGQNLVQNPGFESVSAAPTGENQLNLASPWLPLNASPDLFYRGQTAAVPCDNVGIPLNAGGFCEERSLQNAYAGIQVDFSNGYREYLSVPLSVPLITGEIYRIEFYIQLADSSRFSFSRMGALLTNNVPIQPGTGVLNFNPALEWTGNVTDTSTWTYITGLYQAAGGENYLTVGLFRNDGDPGMLITDFGTNFSGCDNYDNSAYYYIDDVSVKPVSESVEIGGDTVLCPGETITLIANSNVPFWWSEGSAPNDTISQNSLLDINPVVPTWYYLNGLTTRDSVLVTIVNPPVFTLGPDTAVCQDDSLLADATESTALSYLWSTGDSTASIYIYEPGQYFVEVANLGCVRTDTLEVGGFLDNPPLSLGEDSLYCFFYKDTLFLDGGPGASWLWSPTGDTTRFITILQPDTYYVSVIRDNGCRRTASLEVNEACQPLVYIPNAFTPDGDGLNDVIGASVNNADNYSLRIVNRRGQTVFYTDIPGEGWDGKFEGKDAPIGVYIYRLNYHGLDFEGSKYNGKQLGSITLIR